MKSRFMKFCSWVLTVVLLVNMLPAQAMAEVIGELTSDDTATLITDNVTEDAHILTEVVENRTEYSKEYKLSNGLLMAIVYPESVHYEKDGRWEDIDNTLQEEGTDAYTNTADSWKAHLPKQLNSSSLVTVEKGEYSVSFGLIGAIQSGSSDSGVSTFGFRGQSASIANPRTSRGQIQELDYSEQKEKAQYPEVIRDKLKSRLHYSNVYAGTDIVYDLSSGELKESIVIKSYDETLLGYQYTLSTNKLTPVLKEDGSIDLFAANSDEPVMTMPAPYLIDNAGVVSYDVAVSLEQNGNAYTLIYQLPAQWMAAEDRAWPVVLDPAVLANSSKSNLLDQTVTTGTYIDNNTGCVMCGYDADNYGKMRTYIEYKELPKITSADIVVYAELDLLTYEGTSGEVLIEAHKVLDTWLSTTITWDNKPDYNPIIEDYAFVDGNGRYIWDITEAVQEWFSKENTGIMLKVPDSVENAGTTAWKKFYSIDYDRYNPDIWPYLTIVYRNTNGLESYWDYTSTAAGRAGAGYVNNYTGNLTWVRSDIGFGGNRMPVSISHVYNTNDSATNNFYLGYGWRTNFHQTLSAVQAVEDTLSTSAAYVWEDGDGTKHYFEDPDEDGVYTDEDGLELTLTISGGQYTITDKSGNTSIFDGYNRLVKMRNNQQTKSEIVITYEGTTKKITEIKDGAGRKYSFTYSNDLLNQIAYKGTGSTTIAYVNFSYIDSQLTSITDQDGKVSTYDYETVPKETTDESRVPVLMTITDVDGYNIQYTYSNTLPHRVIGITEADGDTIGSSLSIEYGHNQTIFTDHNNNTQISQYNDWGNLISVQDSEGHAQFAQYALNKYDEKEGKGNQLNLSSKMQNTVVNLLLNSSFEESVSWTAVSSNASIAASSAQAYLGNKSLAVTSTASGTAICTYGAAITLPAGESCTFSAYVLPSSTSVRLGLGTTTTSEVTSDSLSSGSGWTRLEVSYTNTSSSSVTVRPQLITGAAGTVYMDCVQAELEPTASRYNIIENGDFRNNTNGWILSEKCDSNDICVNTGSSAAPQMSSTAFQIVGNPNHKLRIRQEVPVSGQEGDTYVLAGWAKGKGVPLINKNSDIRTFTIRGTFLYTDGTTKAFNFTFNPDTDGDSWQYCCGVMVAERAYSGIKIQVLYDYGANTIYFDGIQLFKETFGSSYTYDDNGNVTEVVDLQNKNTTYQYADNQLTAILQDGVTKMTYEYDNYHNVIKATTATGVVYEFTYDAYGNNTSVSIVSGSTKITATATYSTDGNILVSTTDALAKTTQYGYNVNTNVLEWVQYPEDTTATRTEYTYDSMYRLATAEADLDTGTTLKATYTYTDDLLTSLRTGSNAVYTFTYGDFSQISKISVGSRTLATYTYNSIALGLEDPDPATNNNYLREMRYGNDDFVTYSYDDYGRLILETYEDGDTVSYAYDNNGALATVVDSATGIKTTYYYDFTDRLMKYTEAASGFSHSVEYLYDTENNLTSLKEIINGVARTLQYTYDTDNRVTMVQDGATRKFYTYDAYGRLTTRRTNYDWNIDLTQTFGYKPNSSQVSSLTTNVLNYNQTLSYTYDGNGNILSVSDGTYTTTYAYDSANQLVRENNQAGGFTHVWTYDAGGNITSRKEYAYTTGTLGTVLDTITYGYYTGTWRDLLEYYDGEYITTDDIGNLIKDEKDWLYTWQNGRELASLETDSTTWTFTYDANGMRTKRTNGTTTYTYVYNGGNLSQMTVDGHTLRFSYDAQGPMFVKYDTLTYQYILNLQGDVIGIMDPYGAVVVQYTYDAWGNILSTTGSLASTLGQYNPLRYRSYVFDPETELYYLQTRYYNPEWGRFINADNYPSTGQGLTGNNMFAYCGNNPVSREDDGGEFWNIVIGAVVGAVVSGIVSIAAQAIENKGFDNINWGSVGVAAAAGAVSGAFAATGIPVGGQIVVNAAIGTVSSVADTYVSEGSTATLTDYASSAFTGLVLGAAGGYLGGNGSGTKHLSKSAGRLFKKVGAALGDVFANGIEATGKTILKAGKYYYSQVAKQSIQCGRQAILPIIVSNIPTAAYNTWGALS